VISALLLGATVMVLLSACAGAGALLLSRATSRVNEIGVRFALGASRTRLVRQLLTDSVAISLAGGVFGLLLSHWTAGAIPSLFASEHAEMLTPRLDLRVFLFTLTIAVLAGAVFGLAPAVFATNPIVALALRSDPGGISCAAGGARLRATLVITQVALSIVLLVSTLQLVRGLTGALSTPASVIAGRVAVGTVLLPGRYENQVGGIRYKNDATDYLRGLPGVESVEWVSSLPLAADNARAFLIARDGTGITEHAELQIVSASNGYFAAMGIPRLVGRVFDSRDHALAPPVLVVNDVLAQRYFGGPRFALQRHLLDPSGQRLEIVGVVESARYRTLQPPPAPMVYYPATQNYHVRMNVVVKSSRDPVALVEPMRQTLETTDSKATVLKAMTLGQHLSEALVMERLATVLVGTCGLMTMVLAIVGVYGVMADAVIRRTRELGVRMALGARRLRIVQLVLTQGLSLAASGVAVGVVGAFAAMRVLQWLVQGVAPLDTATFVLIPAVLALMVVLASVLPVRRALAVNPTVALRHE
jgi:putative ABC transport system permease protein